MLRWSTWNLEMTIFDKFTQSNLLASKSTTIPEGIMTNPLPRRSVLEDCVHSQSRRSASSSMFICGDYCYLSLILLVAHVISLFLNYLKLLLSRFPVYESTGQRVSGHSSSAGQPKGCLNKKLQVFANTVKRNTGASNQHMTYDSIV